MKAMVVTIRRSSRGSSCYAVESITNAVTVHIGHPLESRELRVGDVLSEQNARLLTRKYNVKTLQAKEPE